MSVEAIRAIWNHVRPQDLRQGEHLELEVNVLDSDDYRLRVSQFWERDVRGTYRVAQADLSARLFVTASRSGDRGQLVEVVRHALLRLVHELRPRLERRYGMTALTSAAVSRIDDEIVVIDETEDEIALLRYGDERARRRIVERFVRAATRTTWYERLMTEEAA